MLRYVVLLFVILLTMPAVFGMLLPETCYFSSDIWCRDFNIMTGDDLNITVQLINDRENMSVSRMSVVGPTLGGSCSTVVDDAIWEMGSARQFSFVSGDGCTFTDSGKNEEYQVRFEYVAEQGIQELNGRIGGFERFRATPFQSLFPPVLFVLTLLLATLIHTKTPKLFRIAAAMLVVFIGSTFSIVFSLSPLPGQYSSIGAMLWVFIVLLLIIFMIRPSFLVRIHPVFLYSRTMAFYSLIGLIPFLSIAYSGVY